MFFYIFAMEWKQEFLAALSGFFSSFLVKQKRDCDIAVHRLAFKVPDDPGLFF